MNSVAEALMSHHDEITKYLYIGYARWDDLISSVERQERKPSNDFDDEQIWTFLVGCGYAIAGEDGVATLTKILTGSNYEAPTNPKIWFEVLPIPPRKGEKGTHLDLALGTIARRSGTKSGIELENLDPSWICFCEMKWYSDIAYGVSYDRHRNQLVRVIENALCFQKMSKFARKIHVVLVTPKSFQEAPTKSRLYQYKYSEYFSDPSKIEMDLEVCQLDENDRPDWEYPPDIQDRISKLSLGWISYETLFESIPMSGISDALQRFVAENNKSGKWKADLPVNDLEGYQRRKESP
ncbi:MAG: hypothetical protein ACFE9O_12725 [Promethearchaeota archaeon]